MGRAAQKESSENLLAYFSEQKNIKSDKTLRTAIEASDAADVWRLWRVRVRARLDLIRPHETLPTLDESPLDSALANVYEFYRALLETADALGSLPPELWLTHLRDVRRVLDSVTQTLRMEESPLAHQILLGEIPLTLGALYPELDAFAAMTAFGKRNLIDGLREITDALGLPDPRFLSQLRPLLACWVRSQKLADRLGLPLFTGSVRKRLEWVTLALARLTRPDGSAVFSHTPDPVDLKSLKISRRSFLDLMNAAAALDRDEPDHDALAVALNRLVKKFGSRSVDYFGGREIGEITPEETPDAFCFSEDSSLALLRGGWSPDAPALFVRNDSENAEYAENAGNTPSETEAATRLEFYALGRALLAGNWCSSIAVNGRRLKAVGAWNSQCEEADENRLYAEYSRELENGWSLERHLLLIPGEELLLLTDSLVRQDRDLFDEETDTDGMENADNTNAADENADRLEGCFFLPFAEGLYPSHLSFSVDSARKTPDHEVVRGWSGKKSNVGSINGAEDPEGNELLLEIDAKPVARLLPISLPEWKSDKTYGARTLASDGVTLTQTGLGDGLFTAVILDLSPRRIKRKFTWRRLTVGDRLAKVSDGTAVGFRIQLGSDQYLLYRSLAEPTPRSVLGQHWDQDFVFGKFDPESGFSSLLEITPNEDFGQEN